MEHNVLSKPPSPRESLAPLSTRDLPPFSLPAVRESSASCASSPISSALSPTQSDISTLASDKPDASQNPILRRAISCGALPAEVKQRRKRSRVSPEQLIKLEEYFAVDNSPTSARRRDIARELGMDERQTQIWFQNRRAKAKLQLKLKARAVEKLEPPPESPPELSSGYDMDIHGLIHEDEEVTVFPCSDLTIGSWRRMGSSQHDLIAYTCEAKRCLTWFIRSGGRSFKMDVLYEHIAEARFTNLSPGTGSATFYLERPPTFYMEGLLDLSLGEDSPRIWQVCGDWTEGRQGTNHLQHTLAGPAYQLSALVNSINPSAMASEALYTPTASVSDAGSSPEVFTRSLHSPIDQTHTSSLPIRRPSSLSSLRMLHHPSLERLRARPSVPLFHSPLSSTLSSVSSPNSPYTASETSVGSLSASMSPGYPYSIEGCGTPGLVALASDQLAQLPLGMSNLPRLNYEYQPMSRSASPYDCGSEPVSAASTSGGYYGQPCGPWGGPPSSLPMGAGMSVADTDAPSHAYVQAPMAVEERPQEPYYPYPNGLPGPVPTPAYAYEHGGPGV
ncbi:homeobox-domain-containing protein [Epithele typhae]|uniref:homeobox-domain-containing protein n=1 Tax=Epithele typhae TaxID=378194 RepID=UPI0020080934|nr:homeobox-domain-containing protein [Epithele typhae]KAH9945489.1 homeobox-domain-containing protein [Epithele typhae]